MTSLMTPFEAAWDYFLYALAGQFGYLLLYKPDRFTFHDTLCIPQYYGYSIQTQKFFWIMIFPKWPLPESFCNHAISLCEATKTSVLIFVGDPYEQRGVVYQPYEEGEWDSCWKEPTPFGWDNWWKGSTRYIGYHEYFQNLWLFVDTKQKVTCAPALPYHCQKCHAFRFQSFFDCYVCGDFSSWDGYYRATPFLRKTYINAMVIYDLVRTRQWTGDYYSSSFGSPVEQMFWEAFVTLPCTTSSNWLLPQWHLGKFWLDFGNPELKVAVEIDGHATHSSPDAIAYDRQRQRYIVSQGWEVIRFGGKEVFHNARACAEEALNFLSKKAPTVQYEISLPRCQNPTCDKPIQQVDGRGHRKREYCSDRCRQTAHRARLSEELRTIREDIKIIKGVILN